MGSDMLSTRMYQVREQSNPANPSYRVLTSETRQAG